MKDQNGLLPCPFCGGAARPHIRDVYYNLTECVIECTKCPAEVGAKTVDVAVEAWNRRVKV